MKQHTVRNRPATGLAILILFVTLTVDSGSGQTNPENLLLKDFTPVSIYKIPRTEISKAKFPAIDVHSHPYAKGPAEIEQWVRNMDDAGIEKTIILTYASGAKFDSIFALYSKHPDRFVLWCGFDFSGHDRADFGPAAVKELERCYRVGARGVGEITDKGKGLYSGPTKAYGLRLDSPKMDPLLKKCAELNMPVNIHIAEPIWMYEPMDATNDGLMNAYEWRLDNQPDIIDHNGMIDLLERAVKRHPQTTFIACHLANCSYDLNKLGNLLDRYANLYADIGARYAETAPIPRFVNRFFEKYQDRLLYGTDMGFDTRMYRITFRILESEDEHFYESGQFGYHWALNGFGLSDQVLRKLYRDNALRVLSQ